MAVLAPGPITKNAKITDKIVTPNPSFLLPIFAFLHIGGWY
jgi:hypothetical protein